MRSSSLNASSGVFVGSMGASRPLKCMKVGSKVGHVAGDLASYSGTYLKGAHGEMPFK